MQERHIGRRTTVRLLHHPLDKDYTMQKEWKGEERSNGTTRKPQDGEKDQGPRKHL